MNLKQAKRIRKSIREMAKGLENPFQPYSLIPAPGAEQRARFGIQLIVNPMSYRGVYLGAKKAVRKAA
jgi:hypothetical protein